MLGYTSLIWRSFHLNCTVILFSVKMLSCEEYYRNETLTLHNYREVVSCGNLNLGRRQGGVTPYRLTCSETRALVQRAS